MSSTTKAWTVPMAASLSVLMLLLGVNLLFGTGSGLGPGPDRDRRTIVDPEPDPPIPTAVEQAVDLRPRTATITGYRATARTLTFAITVKDKGCFRLAIQPAVQESDDEVTVLLQRVPAPDMRFFTCPREPYQQTADVVLASALGGRVVRDAGNDGAVVPALAR